MRLSEYFFVLTERVRCAHRAASNKHLGIFHIESALGGRRVRALRVFHREVHLLLFISPPLVSPALSKQAQEGQGRRDFWENMVEHLSSQSGNAGSASTSTGSSPVKSAASKAKVPTLSDIVARIKPSSVAAGDLHPEEKENQREASTSNDGECPLVNPRSRRNTDHSDKHRPPTSTRNDGQVADL